MKISSPRLSNSKKTYKYILISILLVLGVSIFLTTFIITNIYQNTYLKKIKDSENNRLVQASLNSNFMTEYGMDLALQLYFDYTNSKVLFFKEPALDVIQKVLSQLKFRRLSTSFIDSIYLYNATNNNFYFSNSKSSAAQHESEFIDSFITDTINDPQMIESFSIYNEKAVFIPRIIIENKNKSDSKTLYTLIYKNGYKDITNSAVIINISPDWFKEILNVNMNANTAGKATVFAIDSMDRVVINNEFYNIMQDIGQEDWIQEIKLSDNSSGYLVTNINNEQILVNYYKSNNLQIDWMFVSFIKYADITKEIVTLRKTVIIICILLLMIALVLEAIISKRLYNPISTLLSAIEVSSHGIEDYLDTLKNNFFRILLQQKLPINKEDLQNEFTKYHIKLNTNDKFKMILISIDNYHEIEKSMNFKLITQIKYSVLNHLSEVISHNQFTHETVILQGRYMLIVSNVNANYNNMSNTHDRLIEIISEKRKYYSDQYHIEYSIFSSEIESDFVKLPTVYNELMSMASKSLLYGDNLNMSISQFQIHEKIEYNYPTKQVEQLINDLIKGSKLDTVKVTYNEIMGNAKNHSYKALKFTVSSLLLELDQVVYNLKKFDNFTGKYEIAELLDNHELLQNYEDIHTHFYNIFIEIIAHKSKPKKKNDELICKINDIVNREFSNPFFSITDIAEQLHLSPAYVGSLYKKHTFMSLNDYITEVRIKKSNELLVSTDLSINDIAESTGFSTGTYYHKVFKEKTGITPNAYRNANRK